MTEQEVFSKLKLKIDKKFRKKEGKMLDIEDLERQRMDMESRLIRLRFKITDKKRLNQRTSKEDGDLVYLQYSINEIKEKIEEAKKQPDK